MANELQGRKVAILAADGVDLPQPLAVEVRDPDGALAGGDCAGAWSRSADAAERLVRDCGFDPHLSAYGVDPDDFSGFADVALEVQSHNLERNPRDLAREDLLHIYEAAL